MPFISAIRWSRSARWREASVFTFSAGALLVTPESQQRGDFRYRKAELGGASDELKLMNVVIAVVAIAVLAPRSWRQKADRFVVTDHFRAHPDAAKAVPIFMFAIPLTFPRWEGLARSRKRFNRASPSQPRTLHHAVRRPAFALGASSRDDLVRAGAA